MDYGMQIDGILGFNFLKLVGAVIDAKAMEVKTDSYQSYVCKTSKLNNICIKEK
ncbi:hypothetical protein [Paenibacillus polymyxa]|uniref:hypothetical protein n=1 Tax=Paenibacillus polymyxa TaxID=1406 RepID=UPI0023784686|nr:hypothetical protein [Paenibacillus polymyxa]